MTGTLFADLPLIDRLTDARRGTAYFAQHLAELSNADLDDSSLLDGWTRKHLIAHVGYNAIALCRLMDWAATGVETPMYDSPEQRRREIAEGATLNAGAVRNLFAHSVARLDEKWRHLPDSAWASEVRTAQGRTVPASETVWMRIREVWIHAVDLDNGARFSDFPQEVLEALLSDVTSFWRRKGTGGEIEWSADCGRLVIDAGSSSPTTATGTAAQVARWALGRGVIGVQISGNPIPPNWL